MRTTLPIHRILASILAVVFFVLATAGFGLALSLTLQENGCPCHHIGECAITADDGGGEPDSPESEASQGDFNPTFGETPTLPPYAPIMTLIRISDPFRAIPKVYLDRFVPPQNLA